MTHFDRPKFPQEIFDDVIDQLHSDPHSLRICALVSPPWLSSARARRFHRVTLRPPKRGPGKPPTGFFVRSRLSSCQKLLDLIEGSQKGRLGPIAPYIRELHLCEGMLIREWLADEPALPLLLRELVNLRRFEISRSASMRIPWDDLPVTLRSAIQEGILCSTALTELKLTSLMMVNIGELKRMLGVCKGLRVLEVNHLFFKDDNVQLLNEGAKIEVAPLDTLIIGPRTSTTFISYLLHPLSTVSVTTVRNLTLSISGNFADFARLLHASLYVENLDIVLMNDLDLKGYRKIPPSQQFDLKRIPSLRNIKVNIDVLQKGDDPLPWLSTVLRTGIDSNHPTRANAIEFICIIYSLYLPAPYMDRSINTAIFDAWSEVDAILSGSSTNVSGGTGYAYDNLRDVKLHFMLENPIGFGVAPRFLKDAVLNSPGLEKRHMLQINAFDTSR